MFLKYVQIVNFRNLKDAKFCFAEGANTIIGENDAGKSNAVTAMRILLDSDYYYNTKRLKDTDFSFELGDWKGHWIIISAFFDKITPIDKETEICSEMIPDTEDEDFLKSFIRCEGYDYGVVTLFIRPNKKIRLALHNAANKDEFDRIRNEIKLSDYEFAYTSRSQADFASSEIYQAIVGDIENGIYADPENMDSSFLGAKIEILDVWSYISMVFVDALRDVEAELRKPKNPIRRIVDAIQTEIDENDLETIQSKIRDLNQLITKVEQISDIGFKVGSKMDEIIGLVYAPDIKLESCIKEDISSIARNLTIELNDQHNIELLGLGHLNMLYVALKLVEFEYNRDHEVINIMVVEEPEAHIHTHIQKTLFNNLRETTEYTQVIMTTHSTHLAQIADLAKINVLKINGKHSEAMQPINGLDDFGRKKLNLKSLPLSKRLERYLDAKRSVLLFSKGVILVEGDAEEILFPEMVKQKLGVTLDELGIGLINVGSVSFEYIACIFATERLKRRCSIVTDMDAMLDGATKCKKTAADRGTSRKEKLERLFDTDSYVECCYADYTFEVDLVAQEGNRKFFAEVIKELYVDAATIQKHTDNLSGDEATRYDTVLTVAEYFGKGWLATSLASIIDSTIVIPDYLIHAIAFAGTETVTKEVLMKMTWYVFSTYGKVNELSDSESEEQRDTVIAQFCKDNPNDSFVKLLTYMKEYENE